MTSLVFLHGVGGGRGAWDPQVEYFRGRGYRCLAWDQPGYGGTPPVEPYDLESICAALGRFAHDAFPAVLVGHSMGGFVAQEFYARHPERVSALVLAFTSASFGGTGTEFARQFIAARLAPLDDGLTMAQIASRLMPSLQGRDAAPEGARKAEALMSAVPPDTYRRAVRLLTTFDRRAALADIAVPTLLVAGSEDRTAPAKVMARMAQQIPGGELAVLEGCGHLGPMEQPEAFNRVVQRFLERHLL